MLALAFVVLIGYTSRIPRHVEPWSGSDREHKEGELFVKALNRQFGDGFEYNLPKKGNLCVMTWGITDEHKQNAIRDRAISEKADTELTLHVTLEFYSENLPCEPYRLLRTVEF